MPRGPGLPWRREPSPALSCSRHGRLQRLAGRLDGFTVALGHEIEETGTDPGAEDHTNGLSCGGWYDPFEGSENGDKCAHVGADPTGLHSGSFPEPGRANNITGDRGDSIPVQSLWSNQAAECAGYRAGDRTDLPF